MSISKIVISKEGIAELRDSLNTISNHGMARLVARSEVKLTKKSRADKSPAPEWLAGLYRITATNVNVMHDYTAAVCNQIVAGGCDPAAFEAEASKISEVDPDSPNGIVRQSLRDPSQKYVRVYVGMGPNTSYTERYYNAAGEDVTDQITQEIKENFFPVKSGSVKQAEAGAIKEIQPREYKIENVLYFKKGDVLYDNLPEQIKAVFLKAE